MYFIDSDTPFRSIPVVLYFFHTREGGSPNICSLYNSIEQSPHYMSSNRVSWKGQKETSLNICSVYNSIEQFYIQQVTPTWGRPVYSPHYIASKWVTSSWKGQKETSLQWSGLQILEWVGSFAASKEIVVTVLFHCLCIILSYQEWYMVSAHHISPEVLSKPIHKSIQVNQSMVP